MGATVHSILIVFNMVLEAEKRIQIFIVIPFYNEEPNIDYLFERLISVLQRFPLL